jgi:prephenate dehydratase
MDSQLNQQNVLGDKAHEIRHTLLFSVRDDIGALKRVLSALEDMAVNISHIESRPSKTEEADYDFCVDFFANDSSLISDIETTLKQKQLVEKIYILSSHRSDGSKSNGWMDGWMDIFHDV